MSTVAAMAASAPAAMFAGNGGTGFGGGLGNSALTVTDGGSTVNFELATSGFTGNDVVIYLDTIAGGFADTSTFTDNGDGGREAIAGFNATNPSRTTATFASGFGADYALSIEPGNFAGLFNLTPTAGGSFNFVNSANLGGTSTDVTFSINKADVGLPTTGTYAFSFEGTLISTTAYRSNETLGASVVTNPDASGNAEFSNPITFTTADTFSTAPVPEPASISLLVGAAAFGLRRKRR